MDGVIANIDLKGTIRGIVDWMVGAGKPLRPENQDMVDKHGVEITEHPNASAALDKYNNTREIRIFNNDSGKHIKSITLESNGVMIKYDNSENGLYVPVKEGSNFTNASYTISMAEDRLTDKDLGLKIKGGGVSVLLENREEKNWSRNVIIDVSDRPEAKITNNVGSDTRVVLTGLSSEQKTAILNARDNNNVTTDGLSLDANKGIIGYVADSIIVGVGEKHLKPMPKIPTQSNYR